MTGKDKIRSVALSSLAIAMFTLLISEVGLNGNGAPRSGGGLGGTGGLSFVEAATAAEPPQEPREDDHSEADGADPVKPAKTLTDEQISRIRYLELSAMRLRRKEPDHVTVKISKDTIDEFLLSMEGHEDFRGDRARRTFLKMTAPQKLDVIARYKGAAYADKVMITSDPDVFVEFKQQVMPQLIRGCATSGCHLSTNKDAPVFGFSAKRNEQAVYSNFLLLNDLEVDTHRVIDRSKPDESLLLTYLLPRTEVQPELRHPGDVEYRPIFRSRTHPRYKILLKWISSLKHPAEEYGVHIIEPKKPAIEEPIDKPAGDGDKPADRPAGDGDKPTDKPAGEGDKPKSNP